jgi:hypothetical protein
MRPDSFVLSATASCAVVVLAGSVLAQSSGPLLIAQNSVFPLANQAPSLSLDGNELVARETFFGIGANPAPAHIFQRSGGTWSQQQVFSVPDTWGMGTLDLMNVSIRGPLLVIGVSNGVEGGGDVRISEFSGGSWSPLTTVSTPDDFNNFGASVLTREGLVFVGEPDTSIGIGQVHVYRKNGSGWQLVNSWGSPPSSPGTYGDLLADSGDTMLVAGASVVDVRVRGTTSSDWNHQALLDPVGSAFPRSIAIDGDVAVVGSISNPTAWHVEVFHRSGSTWTLVSTLLGSDTVTSDQFGASVGVHGDTIYVGAPGANSNQGAVYVFQNPSGTWSETAKIVPSAPVAGGQFGESLAVDGTTLAVGATTSSPMPPAAGAVYLFDVSPLTPTTTYCTAKVNSQGCLPVISALGVPGATNPHPFAIDASNVINHKTGLLLYSIAGSAATPFQGGTLCLASPLHRTAGQNSGGNPGPDDCSGSYAFDFNARVQSGIDPSLAPGVQVWAQYYMRDSADPFGVGLTDAVVFTIGS